ncbi:MAG: DUF99 family protein [Candidatus Heimdallarchaeota archaeon]|nr:DUF99 family protein [Candidatus Heimdallarchaeota archaeon]MCK4769863.1 DUF99 family protein [Candidatus Heimdallarchaeota archaeon]
MKKNIRIIGIDDAAFQRESSTNTFVFGVIMRGYNLVEGILRTTVKVDGLDATEKISKMIIESKFIDQLKAIVLGSSTIAAFNIIDLRKLYENTSIPVMTVLSQLPNEKEVKGALSHLVDWEERYEVLKLNPPLQKMEFKNQMNRICNTYVQHIGLKDEKEVKELLQFTTYSSSIPEGLRLADMIGQSFKNYVI